jgi:hypothetical protein
MPPYDPAKVTSTTAILGIAPRTCSHEVACWKRAAAAYIGARLAEHFAANPGTAVQLDKYDDLRLRVKDRTLAAIARIALRDFCSNIYDFADLAWEIDLQLNPHDRNILVVTVP